MPTTYQESSNQINDICEEEMVKGSDSGAEHNVWWTAGIKRVYIILFCMRYVNIKMIFIFFFVNLYQSQRRVSFIDVAVKLKNSSSNNKNKT